jgi:hypothetical protein
VHDIVSIHDFNCQETVHACIDDLGLTIESLEAGCDGYLTLTNAEAIDSLRIVRSRLLRLVGEKG